MLLFLFFWFLLDKLLLLNNLIKILVIYFLPHTYLLQIVFDFYSEVLVKEDILLPGVDHAPSLFSESSYHTKYGESAFFFYFFTGE
jgi:hypothetical protein